MGVSLDTYDLEYNIHPRNKQLPCKRLATSGLNVAYGLKDYPTNGPFPIIIEHTTLSGGIQVDITYDQPFVWNATESEGFYICTQVDPENTGSCNSLGGWKRVCNHICKYMHR